MIDLGVNSIKKAIIGTLIIGFFINNAWAGAAINLKSRLNKINSFHAVLIQKLSDNSGNSVQESKGELWVKRPNQFNWHINKPDEIFLISNGKTFWFYDPLINQVVVNYLKDIVDDTPIMLMIRNRISDWEQFDIKQIEDNFELIPKIIKSNLKRLNISISRNGTINQFSTVDKNDQLNVYHLRYFKNSAVDPSMFTFIPPHGVVIDDQRN